MQSNDRSLIIKILKRNPQILKIPLSLRLAPKGVSANAIDFHHRTHIVGGRSEVIVLLFTYFD